MRLTVEILGASVGELFAAYERALPKERREYVADLSREILWEIAERTPVDTGRCQRAWRASAEMIGSGGGALTNESDVVGTEMLQQSQIEATNGVEYVNYLEYGTHRQSPVGMVRRTLRDVAT